MDGVDVCRSLRDSGYVGGIIMVTDRSDELDCVVGLDSGADDYVRKPYGLAELLARLRAMLRRTTRRHDPIVVPSGTSLQLDIEGRRAFAGDIEISLTKKEFGVLTVLQAHRDKVVPRTRLMSEVWDRTGTARPRPSTSPSAACAPSSETRRAVPNRIVTARGVGFRPLEPTRSSSSSALSARWSSHRVSGAIPHACGPPWRSAWRVCDLRQVALGGVRRRTDADRCPLDDGRSRSIQAHPRSWPGTCRAPAPRCRSS